MIVGERANGRRASRCLAGGCGGLPIRLRDAGSSHELGAGDGDQILISSLGEDAAEATSPSTAGVTCGVAVHAQLPRCVLNSPGRGAGLDALNTTIHDGRRWVMRQVAATTA